MVISIASRPPSTSPGVEKILQNNLKPWNACKIIEETIHAKEKFVWIVFNKADVADRYFNDLKMSFKFKFAYWQAITVVILATFSRQVYRTMNQMLKSISSKAETWFVK